jgi:hypothetical protein
MAGTPPGEEARDLGVRGCGHPRGGNDIG